MMAFSIVLLSLVGITEADFFQTAVSQQKQGYSWTDIDCRAPDPNAKSIVMTTPIGNEYVCFKLKK